MGRHINYIFLVGFFLQLNSNFTCWCRSAAAVTHEPIIVIHVILNTTNIDISIYAELRRESEKLLTLTHQLIKDH